ncbi:class F sortase [Pseudonocardia charpentierae]|uniref:Class F sortase n=1 Tax=Pseudonocardia charpentierae TaxID=3075545 RepID=A0ABU2N8J4_9PSEU|nr:class F sortase [Pseudonocardia sp. DSM 45834]MDT0350209.1 class F sortase [Pseudonocardia sp. DSM 45834]
MRERAWATRAAAILLLLVVAGCGQNAGTGSSAPPADSAAGAAPRPAARSAAPATTNVRARSTPVALDVPAIDVHTTGLVDLGLTPSGALDVPQDAATAGWFALSPVPGEVGPAVLAAHVDYKRVPGVFARLREMKVGDTAEVTRSDGATARFTAYRVERFSKSAFPTAEVYGNTDGPELRLVTCGGEFDEVSRHYRDNVVVFARLT